MNLDHTVQVIGHIKTPFAEKFGVPRQPNLCSAKGQIFLGEAFNSLQAIEGLMQHSHLWLLFLFDQNIDQGWKQSVRPPRLGGNKKVGVFSTRSSFRPNSIGMSVVKLLGIIEINGKPVIEVSGVDVVNNTPIIDIKPYIPYSDSVSEARSEMASDSPEESLTVSFSDLALKNMETLKVQSDLRQLISEVLKQDPRPSYKKNRLDPKIYAITLENIDIKWQVTEQRCEVLEVSQITPRA